MMDNKQPSFMNLAAKTIATHTITYLIMGVLALNFLNYAERFARPELACFMRPTTDPIVRVGLLFQPLRGLVFSLAFYPLKEVLFGKKNGWLIMWWILVALGILSTFGATPGSIEGMIYTHVPILDQIIGWLEIVPQALLLSAILFYWVNHPEKKWLSWVMGVLFFIAFSLPILALLVGQ